MMTEYPAAMSAGKFVTWIDGQVTPLTPLRSALSRYPIMSVSSAPRKRLKKLSPLASVAQVLLLDQVSDALVALATPLVSRVRLASLPILPTSLTQFADGLRPATSVGASAHPGVPAGSSRAKAMLIVSPVTLARTSALHTATAVTAVATSTVHPKNLRMTISSLE